MGFQGLFTKHRRAVASTLLTTGSSPLTGNTNPACRASGQPVPSLSPSLPLELHRDSDSLLPCSRLKGRNESPLLPEWGHLKLFISNPHWALRTAGYAGLSNSRCPLKPRKSWPPPWCACCGQPAGLRWARGSCWSGAQRPKGEVKDGSKGSPLFLPEGRNGP